MTGLTSRLRRLEVRTHSKTAGQEAQNTARTRAALGKLTDEDLDALLSAVQSTGDRGLPVRPWEDTPPLEEQRAAWQWAGQMTHAQNWQVWPAPPVNAPALFDEQAAKEEQLSHIRAAWALYAALARVLLEDTAKTR